MTLLDELVSQGVEVSLVDGNQIKTIVPRELATPELREHIRANKPRLIEELEALKAEVESGEKVIDRWFTDSIPQWQKIRQESIEKGDFRRKAYAEYMLMDVLTRGGMP